jgi:hypothetical protein
VIPGAKVVKSSNLCTSAKMKLKKSKMHKLRKKKPKLIQMQMKNVVPGVKAVKSSNLCTSAKMKLRKSN